MQFFPVPLSVIIRLVYAKCNFASLFILAFVMKRTIIRVVSSYLVDLTFVCFSGVSSSDLCGKRVAMFSYGSGMAATMYSITVSNKEERVDRLLKGRNLFCIRTSDC